MREEKRVVLFAFAANLAVALAKFFVYFLTRSSSMLSESIHSLADTGNQVLLLIGMSMSRKPEDTLHPFGYSKERFFWAFVVAMQLFVLGGVFSILEGISKIRHPHEIKNPILAIGLLLFSLVAESFSFVRAKRNLDAERGKMPLFSFLRKTPKVEVLVVFMEDAAAILGLSTALLSISLAIVLKIPVLDGVGSILIGVLLIGVAVFLATEIHSFIVGEGAPREILRFVEETFGRMQEVEKPIYFKSMILGDDYIILAGKVAFKSECSIREIANAIDRAEEKIRAKYPQVRRIFIEPDIYKS